VGTIVLRFICWGYGGLFKVGGKCQVVLMICEKVV
jgi:hypothetical protein